jgi:hypothetical protein
MGGTEEAGGKSAVEFGAVCGEESFYSSPGANP